MVERSRGSGQIPPAPAGAVARPGRQLPDQHVAPPGARLDLARAPCGLAAALAPAREPPARLLLRLGHEPTLHPAGGLDPAWLPSDAMAHQYIFQMYRLSKVYPPDKTVLNDVTLAFLPGAKIGVLGYNGAGKSTVLRIMAGLDTEFRGDAQLAPGRDGRPARAGAPARREQGRARQRRGRRGRDARAARPLQRAGGQLLRRDGRRVRRRAGAHRRRRRVEPRHQRRVRDGRAAPAAGRRRRHQALRRRAPPRRAVPPAARRARPAAARRAHQPPRRRVGRAGSSATWPTTRAPSWP